MNDDKGRNWIYGISTDKLHNAGKELADAAEEDEDTYQDIWSSNASDMNSVNGNEEDAFKKKLEMRS